MKLSDFLKQQGLTPDGSKSVHQAFIDNFDENYNEKSFGTSERESIADAFEWENTNEEDLFWCRIDAKWRQVENPENDMLWLLDGKKPPKETDGEDELEERRRKEAVEVADKDSECDQVDSKRKQIGGNHYAKHTIQPWDIIREYELDFFEGSCLKYLLRRKNNRLEDLQKAAHYLEECIKNEQKRIGNA